MEDPENSISVKKYNLLFVIAYGLGIAFINIVVQFFDINLPNFSDMVIMFGCIYLVAARFYGDNERLPDKEERKKIVISNLIYSAIISICTLLAIIMLSADGKMLLEHILVILGSISIIVWIIIFVLVFVFYYFLMIFSYFVSGKILMKLKHKS